MGMRHYYDCRYKATVMAQHHGMGFIPDCWTDRVMSDPERIAAFKHPLFAGRFYVAPRYLHLLEPQVGDYAMDAYGQIRFVKRLTESGRPIGCVSEMFDSSDVSSIYQARIIQRNGVAFHWPRSEDL